MKKNINSVVKYEAGLSKLADRKKIVKLSSNEGAFGASPKIRKILKNSENKIFRYPDPESNALKKEISKKYKLNQNNVICGNGSDEILATVAKIFSGPGDEILYSEYGFLMYPIASQLAGAKGIKVKDINYKNSIKNFIKSVTKKTNFKANLEILRWAKKKINMPTVAIGGINSSNYKKILSNRADFIACSNYIWNNKKLDPVSAINKLK